MKTSIVFNYFNPKRSTPLLRTASFALESLLNTTGEDCEIICADGSGIVSEDIARLAEGRRIKYAPSEKSESFAETYNRGAQMATGEFLILCASDIFFTAPWLDSLLRPLESGQAAMSCPYLSYSDYIAQCYSTSSRRSTFEPCCLTINVNALRRTTWTDIGPIDTAFSGNFNDVDYLIRLRKRGNRAVITDCGLITYLGSVTLNTSSQLRAEKDRATFAAKYPEFTTEHFWHQCWHPLLCRSVAFRSLLKLTKTLAPKHRMLLGMTSVLRWEPLFHSV